MLHLLVLQRDLVTFGADRPYFQHCKRGFELKKQLCRAVVLLESAFLKIGEEVEEKFHFHIFHFPRERTRDQHKSQGNGHEKKVEKKNYSP